MKEFFLKSVLFLIIMWCLLFIMDKYYTRYFQMHRNVCQKPDWILAHRKQHFDFAVIGNSRVYNMMDINLLEGKLGKKGINLGMTGSNYSEQYLILDQFLKNGNSIKNLLIQIDLMSLNGRKVNFKLHNHNYMHLMGDSTVSGIYKDNTSLPRYLLWKYVPFVRYMEFSNKYVFYKIFKGGFECTAFDELDNSKGGIPMTGQKFTKHSRNYWTVDKVDKLYLQKLIELAKKNNMHVILYTAPIYSRYLKDQYNAEIVIKTANQMVDSYEIPYIDFSSKDTDSLNLCKDKYFDETHMNGQGVRDFCTRFGDSLRGHIKNN